MNAQGQKTGGRQKGTPNKITAEVREFLTSLVFDNVDLILQDLRNMTTEEVPEKLHEKQPEDKDEIMAFIKNHLEQKINGKQREAKACLQLTTQTTTNATATSPKQKNKATTQHTPFYRNIPTKRKHKK